MLIFQKGLDTSDYTNGCLFAFGAGMYIFTATVELPLHFVKEMNHSVLSFVLIMLFFVIGCTAIGLVLLDHEHCVAEADVGGSDGHNH